MDLQPCFPPRHEVSQIKLPSNMTELLLKQNCMSLNLAGIKQRKWLAIIVTDSMSLK